MIVGIGHATNHTAADEAADLSCVTPTAAAHAIADWRTPHDEPRP